MPKRSISSISSGVGTVFKNCPQGLPLKFQGASFGAIKNFRGIFFLGHLAGSGPEKTIMVNAGRGFRLDSTCKTCFWCSVVTVIFVTRVLALKCQKKVRALSKKRAIVNINDSYDMIHNTCAKEQITYSWFLAASESLPWSNIYVVVAIKTFCFSIINELIFTDVSLKIISVI